MLELVDDSRMQARMYLPEFAMHNVHLGAPVRFRVQSRVLPVSGVIRLISFDWVPLDPSLAEKEQLAGINPPRFFAAQAWLDRSAELHAGMTGLAKIRVGQRSIASFGLRFARDLVYRRVW